MGFPVGNRLDKDDVMIGDVRIDSITTIPVEGGFKVLGLGDNDVIYWLDTTSETTSFWRVYADPHDDED